MLDRLEAANGPPELDAFLGIRHTHIEHPLGPTHHFSTQGGSGDIQHLLEDRPAHIDHANETIAPHYDIVEHHLTLLARLVHGF